MVSHWISSDSRSALISRTLLSIMADLNSAVAWMVLIRPLVSKSSCPFTNILGFVSSVRVTVSTTVTFIFHSFSKFSTKVLVLISLFTFFWFHSVVSDVARPLYGRFSFLLSTITMSFSLARIRWSVCVSKFQRILLMIFSRMDSGLCR